MLFPTAKNHTTKGPSLRVHTKTPKLTSAIFLEATKPSPDDGHLGKSHPGAISSQDHSYDCVLNVRITNTFRAVEEAITKGGRTSIRLRPATTTGE